MADLTAGTPVHEVWPGDLSDFPAAGVRALFPEPALLRFAGRHEAPLFLSVLLHGNEPVGWQVLQRLQAWMEHHALPRSLIVFIGNVYAAESNQRFCEGQPDFNRIWRGGDTPESRMAGDVLSAIRAARPFAAIDLHNNTGANPHYSLLHRDRPEDRELASLFAPVSMLTRSPPATLGDALSDICPAITAECGRAHHESGVVAAFGLVMAGLHLNHWTGRTDPAQRVYRFAGRVEINEGARMAFGKEPDADIEFPSNLEKWNFFDRPAGSTFARVGSERSPVRVRDDEGCDITDRFFIRNGDRLILARPVTPSMLTVNEEAIRDDCLCYFMETPEARN